MRLELLAEILEEEGLGVRGESIFIHRLDADTLNAIMLRAPLDGVPVDPNLPNYFHHHIQAIVRASDQVSGDELMKKVMKTLTIYNRLFYDTSGNLLMQLNHLIPHTLPRVYPQLDSQGIEWSMDFNTNYVMPL